MKALLAALRRLFTLTPADRAALERLDALKDDARRLGAGCWTL